MAFRIPGISSNARCRTTVGLEARRMISVFHVFKLLLTKNQEGQIRSGIGHGSPHPVLRSSSTDLRLSWAHEYHKMTYRILLDINLSSVHQHPGCDSLSFFLHWQVTHPLQKALVVVKLANNQRAILLTMVIEWMMSARYKLHMLALLCRGEYIVFFGPRSLTDFDC